MYIFSFTCVHPHIVYWGEAATFSRSPPSTGGWAAEVDINCRARRPGNNGHCYVGLIGVDWELSGSNREGKGESRNSNVIRRGIQFECHSGFLFLLFPTARTRSLLPIYRLLSYHS